MRFGNFFFSSIVDINIYHVYWSQKVVDVDIDSPAMPEDSTGLFFPIKTKLIHKILHIIVNLKFKL
jgi:hypothetical protein